MNALQRPAWAPAAARHPGELLFLWDDTRTPAEFARPVAGLLGRSEALTPRGRLALCMGLFEHVYWRLEPFDRDGTAGHVLQASWCAVADPRYLRYTELPRRSFRGPSRAPLWCAATWLMDAVYLGDDADAQILEGMVYLANLARHVAPVPASLDAWLWSTVARHDGHPCALDGDAGACDDPFGLEVGRQRGTLLGRPWLDPDRPPDRLADEHWCDALLRQAESSHNPLLATPEDLLASGYDAEPYRAGPLIAAAARRRR